MSTTPPATAEQVFDPRDQRVPLVVPLASRIGNPMPIALGLLAFQLILFGVEWIGTGKTTFGASGVAAANTYAIIVAAAAQFVAGIICFFRGEGYRGQIATMFGLWLVGFYLLARDESAPPLSAAWFLFALTVPLTVILIPAILHRIWAFIVAFGAIIAMCFVAGAGFVSANHQVEVLKAKGVPDFGTAVTLLHISCFLAWICAAALVWLMVEDLFREHGVFRARED